jgi:hypothetical protein
MVTFSPPQPSREFFEFQKIFGGRLTTGVYCGHRLVHLSDHLESHYDGHDEI